MSYNFSFADNGIYGAADINKITSRLVTSGVEDSFTDGVPYNLSAFNESGALLYTKGVVPETVLTLKVEKAEGENTVLINSGTAFFSDGSVIEIESGGHELSYVLGAKNYVYLKNDLITSNTSYPVCSPEAPSGDCVLLAEIEEDGTITDKRTYAKGKLPGYASNGGHLLKIEDTLSFTLEYVNGYRYGASLVKTYDIGDNNFSFIMSTGKGEWTQYFVYEHGFLGIYNIEDKTHFSYYTANNDESYVRQKLCLHKSGSGNQTLLVMADVSFTDGVLTLSVECTEENITSANSYDIPITLYLF